MDTHFAGLFKQFQRRGYDRQDQTKRTAKMKRTLLGKLVDDAVTRAMESLDVPANFTDLGYANPEDAKLRALPDYKWVDPKYEEAEARKRNEQKVAEARLEGEKVGKPIVPKGCRPLTSFGFTIAPVVVPAVPVVTKPQLLGRNLAVAGPAAKRVLQKASAPTPLASPKAKRIKTKAPLQPPPRAFNPPAFISDEEDRRLSNIDSFKQT